MTSSVFRIAVCDDEQYDLEQVIEKTKEILEFEKISYEISPFESSQKLLEAVEEGKEEYHLLILDVLMEELNGVDLAGRLRRIGEDMMIIFISSSPDFALMGYEVEAARYLVKPVREEKLREALLHCKKYFSRKKEILINTADGIRRVSLNKLFYVEICKRGTLLYVEGEQIRARNTISEIEQEVRPADFCRCHQSFLVNMSYVEAIRRYELTLQGNIKVPISKLRYDSTREKLLHYALE